MTAIAELSAPTGVGCSAWLGVGIVALVICLLISVLLQLWLHQGRFGAPKSLVPYLPHPDYFERLKQVEHPSSPECSDCSTRQRARNNSNNPLRSESQALQEMEMTSEQVKQYVASEVAAAQLCSHLRFGMRGVSQTKPDFLPSNQPSFRASGAFATEYHASAEPSQKAAQKTDQSPCHRWQIRRQLWQALKKIFRWAVTYAPTPNAKLSDRRRKCKPERERHARTADLLQAEKRGGGSYPASG
jgi:hypothetical protein